MTLAHRLAALDRRCTIAFQQAGRITALATIVAGIAAIGRWL